MENINSNYDNYFMRFKKNLWDQCVQNNIFSNIPEDNLENVKKTFESVVSNYQAQILQSKDDKINQVLINEIQTQINSLKIITNQDIKNMKSNEFDKAYESKKKEFAEFNQKSVPTTPNFSDNIEEEPIDNSNLEELINQQIQQRENILKLSDLSNNIISENNIIPQNNMMPQNNIISQNNINSQSEFQEQYKFSENKTIINKIDELKEIIQLQNKILEKIIVSQINILKKIK